MKNFAFAALALSGLTGCVQPGWSLDMPPKTPVYILVKTEPENATVTFLDGTTCETPCRVGVTVPLEMTIARTGYAAVQRTITRTSPSPMLVRLKPVGRSDDVEEVALPDL